MHLYDQKMKVELLKLESQRVAALVGERKLSEKEVQDLSWLSGVMAQLSFGDETPEVVAYVNLVGKDEYAVSMLEDVTIGGRKMGGAKVWARAQKIAAEYEIPIKFYREPHDELSLSYKGWLEDIAHDRVERTAQGITPQDARLERVYDGDEEFDTTKGVDEQLSRSYTIPYIRYASDHTEVKWMKEDAEGKLSCPVAGPTRTRGEIKMAGKYPVMAIYLAKELPSEKYFLLQDRLDQARYNEDWARFNTILDALKAYRNGMRDRSVDIKTQKNGRKYVYFMQFKGFLIFSVIIEKELAPEIQAANRLTRDVWARYNAFKEWAQQQAEELKLMKEAADGLYRGDEQVWDSYHTTLKATAERIGMRAPWLFKALLKPFYRDLFMGRQVAVDLFADNGDIL